MYKLVDVFARRWRHCFLKMASSTSKNDDTSEQTQRRFEWFCEQMKKRSGFFEDKRLKLSSPEMNAVGSSTMGSTVHYLARMCGVSVEERATLKQWMDYIANYVDRSSSKTETFKILRQIDSHLSTRSFLNGTSISLADLYVYASLNPILQQLSFQEKEMIQHLSRWYRNIQSIVENPIWAPRIIFSRNPLYK